MDKMTSRERLRRCYYNEETDRPGIYVRGISPFKEMDSTYDNLRKRVLAECELKACSSGISFVNRLPEETREEEYDENFKRITTILRTPKGELQSSRLVGLRGQPGLHETYFLKDAEDAEKYLSLPLPEIKGDSSDFFQLVAKMGERGIVEAALNRNPASIVVELFGSENFALMSALERDIVHELMERECEILKKRVKILIEQNMGPFFSMLGEEYIVPPLHGRKDFFDFNVKYDKPIIDIIHNAGGRIHIHSHGSIKTVIDGFVELGADVLHPFEAPPMGDITPKEAKEALRNKTTLEGNIQIAHLYETDCNFIREQTEQLISTCFDDSKGLIICPTASPYLIGHGADCTDKYFAMIDTVLNWNKQ